MTNISFVQSETIEVVRERKKSALAWKFFSMENDERAKCNVCHVFISFKGGSTGNLLRHLKTKHTDLDLTPPVKKEDPESEEIKEDNSFDVAENKELAKFVQLLNPRFKLRENPVPRLNEVRSTFILFTRSSFNAIYSWDLFIPLDLASKN